MRMQSAAMGNSKHALAQLSLSQANPTKSKKYDDLTVVMAL